MPESHNAPALHQRALIRHAVTRVLKQHKATAPLFGGVLTQPAEGEAFFAGARVHPNRAAHWLEAELPACGVYTLQETGLESDRRPDPDERRLTLVVEILADGGDEHVDDRLDALALAVETALGAGGLDRIGAAMGAIYNAGLPPGMEPPDTEHGRHPADTLTLLRYTGTDIGLAEDGSRPLGLASLVFELDYETPRRLAPLPEYLLGVTGWNLAHTDEALEAEDHLHYPSDADAAPESVKDPADNPKENP